jgi:di/tricarboxylate transporter
MQIALVLSLLLLAIVLFATEKLPPDVITLLIIVVLVGSGVLTTAEAFEGFSSDIIIILGSIFVISGALQETGFLDAIGERLVRLGRTGSERLLFLLMGSAASISAFMNNTTVAAMLVPPVIGMARNAKTSPSRLLMPLAFASILGGTCTLIGTSTNIAVSGYMAKAQLQPLGLFEIAPIGLVIVTVGIAYMVLIGQRFLPDHKEESPVAAYALRDYLSEIVVLPASPLIGQTSVEWELSRQDFRILSLIRGDEKLAPDSRVLIEEGDTLLVEGQVDTLMKMKKAEGIEIRGKLDLDKLQLGKTTLKIVEVLIAPYSNLIGRTLKRTDFSKRFGLPVLAIHRRGQPLREKIGDVPLLLGDLLLVEGPADRVEMLRSAGGLVVLDEHRRPGGETRKGLYAAGAFAVAIGVGALGWVPLPIAFLAAALVTVLLRGISIEKARAVIDLRLLLLIGGMMAFGTAMEKTGAAALLADWVVTVLSPFGVTTVMGGFFLLTIVLTQPMSNAAAALVVLPVAMSAARALGVQERTFAIAIMLAASISFIAPLEPACILVYGPGRYRFMDFVKVGGGLTLILIPIMLLLIPIFWPLHAR